MIVFQFSKLAPLQQFVQRGEAATLLCVDEASYIVLQPELINFDLIKTAYVLETDLKARGLLEKVDARFSILNDVQYAELLLTAQPLVNR